MASGYAPELLQLVEEPLDAVAFPVERLVVVTRRLAVRPGRDDGFGSRVVYDPTQVVGIVSFVGDHGFRLEAVDQLAAACDVVALARPEQQANRVAKRVGGCMDFGAQAAARAPQPLSIGSPSTFRAPAAC